MRERVVWATLLLLALLWGLGGPTRPSPPSREQIGKLVRELGAPDLEVAVEAAVTLAGHHPSWRGVALAADPRCLDPEHGQRRAMASLACSLMPPHHAPPSPPRRWHVFLPGMPLTASETVMFARGLGAIVDGGDSQMRARAVCDLVSLGSAARPAMTALRLAAVDRSAPRTAAFARLALLQCGEGATDPLLSLLAAATDQPEGAWPRLDWRAISKLLDTIGWAPDRVASELLATAKDQWHMRALGLAGCQARETLQTIIDSPPDLHRVRSSVGKMGRDCPEVVLPFLLRELHSGYWYHAQEAAQGLAELGRAASVAVPDLCAILEGGVPGMEDVAARHVRAESARALGLVGVDSDAVLGALRHALDDSDPAVQREAKLALARLGHDVRLAVELAMRGLHIRGSSDFWGTELFGWSAVEAIDTLAAIGPPATVALPGLRAILSDPVEPAPRRIAAAHALVAIGQPGDVASLEALASILKGAAGAVRTAAAEALAQLGDKGLRALTDALGDERADVSAAAAWALAGAGAGAAPHLQHAVTHGNRRARTEAAFLQEWGGP